MSDFLGIKIEQRPPNEFYLSKARLIDKVLKVTGIPDYNTNYTLSGLEPLGPDKEGIPMDEIWKYVSIIGMLMYLVNNLRPDIAHTVYTCTRYTHNRKKSHATSVKHILKYLEWTYDKELVLKPNKKQALDYYVDSNLAENYCHYDYQDPTSTKYRTGYCILYQWCQILWV